MKAMSDISQAVTAMAVGIAVGFACVGLGAKAVDAWEASRCPGTDRILTNRSPWLKDLTAYGACPRDGLTAPLKP